MTADVSADTSRIDLRGYLARIGYCGSSEPNVDTLHALVAAHNRAIPFENLDSLMGIPVADLSAGALSDKLVARRRCRDAAKIDRTRRGYFDKNSACCESLLMCAAPAGALAEEFLPAGGIAPGIR